MSKRRLSKLGIAMCLAVTGFVSGETIVELVPDDDSRTREVTPIYKLLTYRPDTNRHVSELNDELVALQIAEFTEELVARRFIESHPTLEVIGLRIKREDDIYFIVLLGVYDDADTARWAMESFIEENPRFETKHMRRIQLSELKPKIVQKTSTG